MMFETNRVVVETKGDQQIVHVLAYPSFSDKGHHRIVTLFNTFQHSNWRKSFHSNVPYRSPCQKDRDHSFHCTYTWEGFLEEEERMSTFAEFSRSPGYDRRLLPRVIHEGVFEFFEYIGWDYKRRTYNGPA